MKTYIDTISGETLYVEEDVLETFYFKNKAMTIFHRVDGPAKVWRHGSKFWYRNGRPHRMDGPAKEWSDGQKSWYINGVALNRISLDINLKA